MNPRILAAAVLALALVACQARPEATQPPQTDATTAQDTAEADQGTQAGAPVTETLKTRPEGETSPEASPVTTAAAPPKPDRPAKAALPPEPEIDDDPARLTGLDAAAVVGILGQPELKRRESPAEIWQYRGDSCVFDVFLYEDSGVRRVTYLEARDQSAQPVETRACLNELLRAKLRDSSG